MLAWSVALFFSKVVGGALVLTGVWLALLGLAQNEEILSKVFLVCSPQERAAVARLGSYDDRGLDPEPHFATGSCEARVRYSGSPERLAGAFAEGGNADGWEVSASTDGIGGHLRGGLAGERPLLTATRNGFYWELAYVPQGGTYEAESKAAVLRLRKL